MAARKKSKSMKSHRESRKHGPSHERREGNAFERMERVAKGYSSSRERYR